MKDIRINQFLSRFSRYFGGRKPEDSFSRPLRFFLEVSLAALGLAISCYYFYPGCISGDLQFSLYDSTIRPLFDYSNQHPPLIALTWRLLNDLPWHLTPYYADLFVAMNIVYWMGLVLALRPWYYNKCLWLVAFAGIGFFLPAFGILSEPIKDSLMCAAMLAAYGNLLAAEREHSKTAFILGLLFLFLALGYRYNALFAVFPLAMWAGAIACRAVQQRWKKIAAGMLIFITLLGSITGFNYAITGRDSYPVQQLFTFDLVGISVKSGHVYLPELYNDDSHPSPFFEVKGAYLPGSPLTLENLELLHLPDTNLNIYWYGEGKGLRFLDNAEEVSTLRKAWLDAIIAHPMTYLEVRKELFFEQLGFGEQGFAPYFCMYMEESPNMLLPAIYPQTVDAHDWLFRGGVYVALLGALLALACWKRRIFPLHVRIIGASGLIYALGYFPAGVSSEPRYLFWLMPVSLIMAVNIAFIAMTLHKKRGA